MVLFTMELEGGRRSYVELEDNGVCLMEGGMELRS